MFTPIFLWDSIPTWLQHIFLNGLVQPPTRTTIMTVQPVQQKDLEAAKALWNLRLVLAQQHFPPFRSIMFLFSQTSELARHTSHISLLYHVSIYIYMYLHMSVCIYIYILKIYIYIHISIYTYIYILLFESLMRTMTVQSCTCPFWYKTPPNKKSLGEFMV